MDGTASFRQAFAPKRAGNVRITVFSSAIVIDVIVHCHTAGALWQKTIVPIIVWLGFDPFRPVQNHIGSWSWESSPLLRALWTETSAITFSTFSIPVTFFLRPLTVATGA